MKSIKDVKRKFLPTMPTQISVVGSESEGSGRIEYPCFVLMLSSNQELCPRIAFVPHGRSQKVYNDLLAGGDLPAMQEALDEGKMRLDVDDCGQELVARAGPKRSLHQALEDVDRGVQQDDHTWELALLEALFGGVAEATGSGDEGAPQGDTHGASGSGGSASGPAGGDEGAGTHGASGSAGNEPGAPSGPPLPPPPPAAPVDDPDPPLPPPPAPDSEGEGEAEPPRAYRGDRRRHLRWDVDVRGDGKCHLRYDTKLKILSAHCCSEAHGDKCRMNRTCNASASISREAQGRPLGALLAWMATECESKSPSQPVHSLASQSPYYLAEPGLRPEVRARWRQWLHDQYPEVAREVSELERRRRDGEPEEPEGFP